MQSIGFNPSRRGFLLRKSPPVRPPWALPEADFVEACSRCNACAQACPQHIIRITADGLPKLAFSQGCDFCGACEQACDAGALDRLRATRALPYTAVVLADCLAARGIVCRACADTCSRQAISFSLLTGGRAKLHVNALECTGCGECIAVCPTRALALKPVPQEQAA